MLVSFGKTKGVQWNIPGQFKSARNWKSSNVHHLSHGLSLCFRYFSAVPSNKVKKKKRTVPSILWFGLKEKTTGMAGSQGHFLQASSHASETSDQAHCGLAPAFLGQHEGGRRGPLPHLCRGQIPGWLHQIAWRGTYKAMGFFFRLFSWAF